jgi:uroporphyrinogen decarboxylase
VNGRERVLAALRGERPDRVPVMLHNFLMAARENGVPMSVFRRNGRAVAESFIRAVETYGYDGIVVDIDTATLAGAVGVPVDYPDDLPARCRGPLLRTLAEARKLAPADISGHFSVQAALEAVAILKDYFKNEIAVRGNCDQAPFSLAGLVRSLDAWLLDLIDGDQELIGRVLDFAAGATTQFLRLMAAAGADILSNGDSPAGPDLVSPAMYAEFAEPYEKRLVDEAHALGKRYALHICGDTTRILERMLKTGADALELDYKTDARTARDALKGRAVFIGNIDPSGVLALGTPKLVEAKVRALLEVFADVPGFILNAGCAIPAETPAANLLAMISAARNA